MSAVTQHEQLENAMATIEAIQEELLLTQQGVIGLTAEYQDRLEKLKEELRAAHAELRDTNSGLMELTLSLEQRTVELTASNKELEQFAYVASHDLQEPLRMITSYMKLLELRLFDKLDVEGREFIGFAIDGAKRMQALIQDLLAYSRVGRKEQVMEPVDMNGVIQNVINDLRMRIEEEQAVIDCKKLPLVRGDAGQLYQLLLNLVSNAIKFRADAAPRVVIRAERLTGEMVAAEERLRDNTNWWRFSVQDNGIGFEQKFAERIFQIFQRLHTRQEYQGTGIGLAICRKIVERHGGRIDVASAPGQGTCFYFQLLDIKPEQQFPRKEQV